MKKNILVGSCGFFVSDITSEVLIGAILAHVAWLGPIR